MFQTISLYGSPTIFLRMIEYIILLFLKFPAVLVAMLCSTIPISIIGAKFAMVVTPFWTPIQFSTVYSLVKNFTIKS
jgi:hypothetical protein